MKLIHEVLNAGIKYLSEKGCEDARHSMQSLLVHVLGKDKTWLYLHYQDALNESSLTQLRDLLRRRGQGEPLQHLLGSVEFYRREFRSDSRALIPRPETEELVELALKEANPQLGMRILDMGTGSGVIGISLALELAEQQAEVTMIDISEEALGLALENATRLGARVKTYRSDLFSLWKDDEQGSSAVTPPSGFHLILANLPYVPDVEKNHVARELHHDPDLALYGGIDGMDVIEKFLQQLPEYAASNAIVLLEVGHDQGEKTRALMEQLGYSQTRVLSDLNGIARFPLGHCPIKEEKEEQEEVTEEIQAPPSSMPNLRLPGMDDPNALPF